MGETPGSQRSSSELGRFTHHFFLVQSLVFGECIPLSILQQNITHSKTKPNRPRKEHTPNPLAQQLMVRNSFHFWVWGCLGYAKQGYVGFPLDPLKLPKINQPNPSHLFSPFHRRESCSDFRIKNRWRFFW